MNAKRCRNLIIDAIILFQYGIWWHRVTIANANTPPNGYSMTSDQTKYHRPYPPIEGTINWQRLNSNKSETFSPRHSHASCVFQCPHTNKDCLWITGGRTELYRAFNLQMEDRAADVWWSEDGATWNKVMELTGDFLDRIGNHDAKIGGEVAPWFGRFGHTLDSVDVDGDSVNDIMVLIGGFHPLPANDVWISPDGVSWFFAGFADWPGRAYHASVSNFNGRHIWIMGGSPLSNDVWSANITRDDTSRSGYKVEWKNEVKDKDGPWAPRAGMCATTQVRKGTIMSSSNDGNDGTINSKEYLYLIGGFAGWPREDPRWNGDRTRNDVWITTNGKDWELVMPPQGQNTMPFVGRGWHACATWHEPHDRSKRLNSQSHDDFDDDNDDDNLSREARHWPRIYITGGGYTGTKGNQVVTTLEGYVDTWYSHDGSKWTRVDYEEGFRESLYSTNEWTSTLVDHKWVHRGKWGHSLESFIISEDINQDGMISNESISIEYCTDDESGQCKVDVMKETKTPALVVIGGDTTDGGPIVSDVYVSRPGVHCEINGVTCNGRGFCGPGTMGCVCNSELFLGEYCQIVNETYTSQGRKKKSCSIYVSIVISLVNTVWIVYSISK